MTNRVSPVDVWVDDDLDAGQRGARFIRDHT